jgi:hypothetical protein
MRTGQNNFDYNFNFKTDVKLNNCLQVRYQ